MAEAESKAESCKIIRASISYSVVLVMSPADAAPGAEGTRYFEYHPGRPGIPGWKDNEFNETSWKDGRFLFSGHADGMGFADFPTDPFPSLEAALAFIKTQRGQ